jgi:hypothetical protein
MFNPFRVNGNLMTFSCLPAKVWFYSPTEERRPSCQLLCQALISFLGQEWLP